MPTYRIDYRIYRKDGSLIKAGTTRVKNKDNELFAKLALDGYLRERHPEIDKIYLDRCVEDYPIFGDIFKDIFNN